jgi:hypothetical protein
MRFTHARDRCAQENHDEQALPDAPDRSSSTFPAALREVLVTPADESHVTDTAVSTDSCTQPPQIAAAPEIV